jgi:uncharacterized protein YggU (UPF0235/DUF167 family)
MIGREFHFHDGERGAALAIRIKELGKVNKFDRVLKDGTLVITLMKNTSDINQELIGYLSQQLGIDQKRFDIIAGNESNEKLISVLDIGPAKLQEIVLSKLA